MSTAHSLQCRSLQPLLVGKLAAPAATQEYSFTLNPKLTHKQSRTALRGANAMLPTSDTTVKALCHHFIWDHFYEWCPHSESNMLLA